MGLNYYADMNDVPLFDLLRKSIIKNQNQSIALSYSSWKDWPDTDRSKGEYIILYQGGPIDHATYITGPVDQSSA